VIPLCSILCAGAHGSDIAADADFPVRLYDDNIALGHQPLWVWPGGVAVIGLNDGRARHEIASQFPRFENDGSWNHTQAWVDRSDWGEHTHINVGCVVVRAEIGRFCTLSPRVTVCGDVSIGDFVTIGAAATISNLVTIGDGATIGAGAVVPPRTNVPAGETRVGVPGRPVR
jgi:acetyltransferase-like isoleucine patch superfamily enzyme